MGIMTTLVQYVAAAYLSVAGIRVFLLKELPWRERVGAAGTWPWSAGQWLHAGGAQRTYRRVRALLRAG